MFKTDARVQVAVLTFTCKVKIKILGTDLENKNLLLKFYQPVKNCYYNYLKTFNRENSCNFTYTHP